MREPNSTIVRIEQQRRKMCDASITMWKIINSAWFGRLTGSSVSWSATSMTQQTFRYMHYMLSSCLTHKCEALIYSSAAADCCCSKALYWPRPTLMLHPSNAAAAWPTFFACHTVATVPVSGRQAQRESSPGPSSDWKAHIPKQQTANAALTVTAKIRV